ncbi:MAG TPA: exoribonuclease R [Thermoanaerobacterales bacterium]|nr:exoribonuclease R [Thermoanaerobacterales bacterium]
MLNEYGFTEARNDFSRVFNMVFNEREPAVIRRNRDQEVLMLRKDLLKDMLSAYVLDVDLLPENDCSFTVSIDILELAANGSTQEEALNELIQDLKIYAQDYMERSQLFLNAPNRKHHLPYLLRILLCDSDEEIKSLLKVHHAS